MSKAPATDHSVLMAGDMIRAYQAGRKTQTRRALNRELMKWNTGAGQSDWCDIGSWVLRDDGRWHAYLRDFSVCLGSIRCRYGQPGHTLWFQETWAQAPPLADGCPSCRIAYRADGKCVGAGGDGAGGFMGVFHGWLHPGVTDKGPSIGRRAYSKWKSSMVMPRWAARYSTPLLSVRIERVQDISDADCYAEGIEPLPPGVLSAEGYPRIPFRKLIESHGRAGIWERNDWVFVLGFEPHKKGATDAGSG